MTEIDNKINNLQDILNNFIEEQRIFNSEQRIFNSEQRIFNSEQRIFNENIDKKIDKVQYFLEETMAENTKMFFEEQIELKVHIKELEDEVSELRNDLILLTSDFKDMKLRFS